MSRCWPQRQRSGETVLASPVVCSDETSARVNGKNWWEWVFVGTLAVLHVIRPSRGKAVVHGAVRRDQAGGLGIRHAGQPAWPWRRSGRCVWRICCAMRRYAVECGDTASARRSGACCYGLIAIGRRRETLKDTTLKQYLADLDRRLDRIMAAVPLGEPGRKLRKRIAANRAHLFVFMTNRDVPYTNNVSERHLRPSVIFRKVTNGFRCEWGAETYAAFRSVVSTAKANRASVFDTIHFVLSSQTARQALISPG